jgi:hypothetical protein
MLKQALISVFLSAVQGTTEMSQGEEKSSMQQKFSKSYTISEQ